MIIKKLKENIYEDIYLEGTLINNPKYTNKKNLESKLKNITLKKHQQLMLSYMEYIEKHKKIKLENNKIINANYGFLCDIVGSGKSIIILSLILNNPKIENKKKLNLVSYFSFSTNYESPNSLYSETLENREKKSRSKVLNLSLIVVPHGIIEQWKQYLENFTSNIKYLMIKTKDNLNQFIDIHEKNELKNYTILLVSASKFNNLTHHFKYITISRLIIDEVDSITIPNCSQQIDAIFTWFVSSSITNIRYGMSKHLGLINNVLRNNVYRLNKYIILKNENSFIKQSMELQEPIFKNIICYQKILAGHILRGLINDKILTMIHANAINEVSSILNIQKTNDTNIVSIICEKLSIEKQNCLIELESILKMTYTCDKLKKTHIENKEKEIKSIQEKINLIENRIKDDNIDPITLEKIQNVVVTKCCQNKFEMESILKCIKENNKCPYCRKIINTNDIIIIDNNNNDESKNETIHMKLDKYERLEAFFKEECKSNEKLLIFSEYNESFEKIKNILRKLDKKFEELKGTSYRISNIVESYTNSDLNILLLNAKFYGSGLNLINTDYIILFHKMNIDLENQVVGRAQRIGREKKLYVWNFLHHNEI